MHSPAALPSTHSRQACPARSEARLLKQNASSSASAARGSRASEERPPMNARGSAGGGGAGGGSAQGSAESGAKGSAKGGAKGSAKGSAGQEGACKSADSSADSRADSQGQPQQPVKRSGARERFKQFTVREQSMAEFLGGGSDVPFRWRQVPGTRPHHSPFPTHTRTALALPHAHTNGTRPSPRTR
jgi:hypothetical protein